MSWRFLLPDNLFSTVKIEVVAYELLYSQWHASIVPNRLMITKPLPTYSPMFFLQMGIDTIAEGKRAFVNFNEALLLQEVPQLLPSHNPGSRNFRDGYTQRDSAAGLFKA